MSTETWESVHPSRYTDYYDVSDQGRVRSRSRTVSSISGGRTVKGRVLTPSQGVYVRLSVEDITTTFRVDELVIGAFIRPIQDKEEVIHLNGDHTNHRLENLRISTTATTKDGERWKDIPGYEGLYKVSNLGRVKSVGREITKKDGHSLTVQERVLKPSDRNGYESVVLYSRNGRRTKNIHALVAKAFIGPRPKGYHVNHIDGDKKNNNVDNLEYVTPEQNTSHAVRIGIRDSYKGSTNPSSKLNQGQIIEIRDLYDNEAYNQYELAELYGVSRSHIGNIVNRKAWTHI